MATEVFLDTAYAIALSSPNDLFHLEALRLAHELDASSTRLVTTRATVVEMGNALAKQRHRSAAVRLLFDCLTPSRQIPTLRSYPFGATLRAGQAIIL